MFYWRCLARGARRHFSDVCGGYYLPDELDETGTVLTDAEGNVVELDEKI